ncbi:MAG: MTH1187 family thiamine-binding protein [Deltaproteobacteria bacterium]
MPNANLSLQVLPRVPDDQLYGVVDQVIAMIQASGLNHVVGPMETTIEGDLDELLELVRQAQNICVDAGANRVISVVKIDYKPGGVTIDEKIGKYRP